MLITVLRFLLIPINLHSVKKENQEVLIAIITQKMDVLENFNLQDIHFNIFYL